MRNRRVHRVVPKNPSQKEKKASRKYRWEPDSMGKRSREVTVGKRRGGRNKLTGRRKKDSPSTHSREEIEKMPKDRD